MKTLSLFLLLFQVAVSGQQPQAPAVSPEQPKAVVRGHVYALDTGAPLKRAQVSLRNERPSGPAQRFGEGPTVSTDAQGAFEFRNLEPGTYRLSCNKSGYVPASYGQKAPNQVSSPLEVRAGQELKDLDFRLVRSGVISGTIVDEDGEPVSNVAVLTLVRQYRRGQPQLGPRGFASSDDRGQYRLFNLPPGRYYVRASPRGFGDQGSYASVFYPNALSVRDAQRIEVTGGAEVSRVDFHLQSVPAFTVSGRVLDQQTGKPVTGGNLNVAPADAQSFGVAGSAIRPDGSFQLRGLVSGRYRAIIMLGGGEGRPSMPVSRFFELGSANIDNLVLTVGPGVSVRGRLVEDGGTLKTDGLGINLLPKGENFGFGSPGGNAVVNKDLTFEISNVQPGEYDLSVAARGPLDAPSTAASAPFYVREVRAGGEALGDASLTVPEGAPLSDLEVLLDFRGGTVSGRVLDAAGEPVSGARVALVSADANKRNSDRYFRSGGADQNGNYAVRGVIPGDYFLVVWPDPDIYQIQDPDLFAQLEKHALRVTVEASGTANQDVKLTPEIKTIAQNFAQ